MISGIICLLICWYVFGTVGVLVILGIAILIAFIQFRIEETQEEKKKEIEKKQQELAEWRAQQELAEAQRKSILLASELLYVEMAKVIAKQQARKQVLESLSINVDSSCCFEYVANDREGQTVYFFNYDTPYFVLVDDKGMHKIPLSNIVCVDVQSDNAVVAHGEYPLVFAGNVAIRTLVKITTINVDYSTIRIFTDNIDSAEDIANRIRAIKFNYGQCV